MASSQDFPKVPCQRPSMPVGGMMMIELGSHGECRHWHVWHVLQPPHRHAHKQEVAPMCPRLVAVEATSAAQGHGDAGPAAGGELCSRFPGRMQGEQEGCASGRACIWYLPTYRTIWLGTCQNCADQFVVRCFRFPVLFIYTEVLRVEFWRAPLEPIWRIEGRLDDRIAEGWLSFFFEFVSSRARRGERWREFDEASRGLLWEGSTSQAALGKASNGNNKEKECQSAVGC